MRKIITFVLSIALAACASGPQESAPAASGAAPAAKAERPGVKVGDRWVSSCTQYARTSDLVVVVTSVDQSGINGTVNGQPLELTPELNTVVSPQYTNSDRRSLSFPLEVGKEWSVTSHFVAHESIVAGGTDEGTEKLSVTVVGYERVRVRAGAFGAFKLKWKSSWQDIHGYSGITDSTYWYAPAARAIVKSELVHHWEPDINCELAEFQLQP